MRDGLNRLAAVLMTAAGVLFAAPTAAGPGWIDIHTEAWQDYTQRDGTGFAWDVIRAVYEPAGIQVRAAFVPYSRAVQDVLAGDADAWVGAYAGEEPEALYPEWHYDADQVQALFLKTRAAGWNGRASLEGARVGWVRAYAYDRYLDVGMKKILLNDRDKVLSMLRLGRIGYWLDAAYEIDHILEKAPERLDTARFTRRDVMFKRLYLGFADTERGRRLRAIWDRRFAQLLARGRIAAIYDRWDMAVWPFDRARSAS